MFDAGPMFSGKANDLAADLSQNLTGGLSAKPQEIMTAAKYGDQKEMAAIAQKHGFTSIDDALKFLAAEDVKRTPYGQYQRLAGEAEARLTQSRMNMTPLDRQMFPPWSQKELGGYDVPESQQIVRFGDGPAMAINPSEYGLPVNPDGTVSLLHGTTKDAANKIIGENRLRSAGEPSVYLTNANDAGYGDGTLVQVDVDPRKLFLDDEFPGGRFDFSMPVRGGVANVKNARMYGDGPAMSTGRPRNHLVQEIPPTPYELAHAEAQRVAALPVEQGGLGLPANNTAMDRARAMGFDTDAYHGTGKEVFDAFDPLISADNSHLSTGGRSWLSTSPKIASGFSGGMTFRDMYPISQYGAEGAGLKSIKVIPDPPYNVNAALEKNGYVMPLKINKSGEKSISNKETRKLMFEGNDDWRESGQELADAMGDNVITKLLGHPRSAYPELRATNYAVKDPSRIRSRFAAFNPAKRDSADLLAGLAPWALPVGATLLGGSFLLPPEEY